MNRFHFAQLLLVLTPLFFLSNSNSLSQVDKGIVSVSPPAAPGGAKAQARVLANYGQLPLSFAPNQGQMDAQVKFLSRVRGYTLFLTGDEAVLALERRIVTHESLLETAGQPFRPGTSELKTDGVLRMKLSNANNAAKVAGLDELAGRSNYFFGNDPSKWRTDVPNYAKVQYKEVYPGIDLVYHGNERELEYDFIVSPGADPRRIVFDILGAKRILRDQQGDLVFKIGDREIRWHRPVVYQKAKEGGAQREVAADYAIKGRDRVSFELAKYDATKPLYIDPVVYSTYVGGSNNDVGSAIAVDSSGNVYVTGSTLSTDFPTTTGAFQTTCNGGNNCGQYGDAFVTKMNASGTALVYSTYLGGTATDAGTALAVDSSGNVYVTGRTSSTDFPTTPGAFQTTGNGVGDAFVTEIDPAGAALVYSTYLGGSFGTGGNGIAVDSAGDTYVTGFTGGGNHIPDDFPTTPGAYSTTCYDTCVFVTQFNPAGTALVYSTYLSSGIVLSGIAVDSSGGAYVTGGTFNGSVPTTPGAFQTTCSGAQDAFVTKFNATGTALVYSTYLCSPEESGGSAITIDNSGNAFVTGYASNGFPITPGAFQTTCPDLGVPLCLAAFVTKINPAGSALVYSTYLGGSASDQGSSIAVDSSGNAFVTGTAYSTYFPTTPGAPQTSLDGSSDAFVTELNPSGSALYFSTYLGGSAADSGYGIALDSSHNAYVVGSTFSSDFPTTPGAFQTVCNGGSGCSQYSDGFVTKFNFDPSEGAYLAPSSLNFYNQAVGSTSSPQTITLSSNGIELPLSITSIQVTGLNNTDFAETNNCPSSLPSTGNCTISVTFTPTGGGIRTAAMTITDGASNSPQTIPITGVGLQPSVAISPSSITFPAQYVGTTGLPQMVTVTNTGATALTVSSVTSNIADFGPVNNCTNSVAPNANCTIEVFFDPGAGGSRSGTLTIADNAAGSPQTIALSGAGQDFSLSVSGSSTATISAGQTASYTLAFAPAGGVAQSVSLTCSGAPAQSTCSVPGSVSLSGSGQKMVTVSVSTAGASASLVRPMSVLPLGKPAMWLVWFGLPGLLVVCPLGSRWRNGSRRLFHGLAFLCVLSLGITSFGCGGGSQSTRSGGTPSGSYNLTVTATFVSGSTTLIQNTKLILVVQ